MTMRGDIELHPRHFVYTFSGIFSGSTVQYFINKVLFSDDTFFSKTNNISEVLFYVFMIFGIIAGVYIDYYVVEYMYQIDHKKFLLFEIITIVVFDLLIAILLVFTFLYKL